MRRMVKGNYQLNVVEHIILRNMWEYYVLADKVGEGDSDIKYALVMGFNDEIGTVSLSEIKPHVLTRTTELSTVFPATGYSWADELPVESGVEFTGQGCPDYPLD